MNSKTPAASCVSQGSAGPVGACKVRIWVWHVRPQAGMTPNRVTHRRCVWWGQLYHGCEGNIHPSIYCSYVLTHKHPSCFSWKLMWIQLKKNTFIYILYIFPCWFYLLSKKKDASKVIDRFLSFETIAMGLHKAGSTHWGAPGQKWAVSPNLSRPEP